MLEIAITGKVCLSKSEHAFNFVFLVVSGFHNIYVVFLLISGTDLLVLRQLYDSLLK